MAASPEEFADPVVEEPTEEINDNKQEQEQEEEHEEYHTEETEANPVEKRWPGWPGDSVFRILIPSLKVGALIGRKGEFIKKICEESKARIKILDAPHGAPERAVMVSAKEEPDAAISPAMDGLLRVHKRVVDGIDSENVPPSMGKPLVTRLVVPATQAGSLIGKQGSTIKSIQESSSTVVRVLDDLPPFALQDDRVVEIQGEPLGLHKAVELIAGHLRRFLVDHSVIPLFEVRMATPHPPMEHNVPPPQPWGHPQGPPPPHAGGPGYGGNHQYMPLRPPDGFYPPTDLPPVEKPRHYGISTYGREAAPTMGLHSSSNQQPSSMVSQVTQHMQIPLSYADAVIGAAGASISYIRRASGATITIQETRGVPGEMTVEINGTASQVQTAQQLIQNFMAEAAAPPSGPGTALSHNAIPLTDQGYGSYSSHGSMYTSPLTNTGNSAYGGGYGSGYGGNYGY